MNWLNLNFHRYLQFLKVMPVGGLVYKLALAARMSYGCISRSLIDFDVPAAVLHFLFLRRGSGGRWHKCVWARVAIVFASWSPCRVSLSPPWLQRMGLVFALVHWEAVLLSVLLSPGLASRCMPSRHRGVHCRKALSSVCCAFLSPLWCIVWNRCQRRWVLSAPPFLYLFHIII